MDVSLETNGWLTNANIRVIGGSRPSTIGRDLMPNLGLQIVQKAPEKNVMSMQGEQPGAEATEEEDSLDPWQIYFSKQFNNLFNRVGNIQNYKVHAVCNSNRSDISVKFLKAYIIAHGVPRQIRVDQGTNFMSKEVRSFCHKERTEMLISPVNDHRATGCVERTIGSIKNSVLTYAREDKPEPLDGMVERALGALRFAKNATLNITPFEAHHGREANTVLRNLTKKPSLWNLNWKNVIRSKSACLDEQDPNAQAMPEPMDTNWGVRCDTEYDRKNRRHPMKLAEVQADNQDDEPGIVWAPNEPAEVPPVVVMQKTGERNMNRYKPLKSSIVNQSDHTIKLSNGAVLRKSGVALKKANIPKKRAPGQIAAPPTPWDLKRKLLASSSQQSSSKGIMGTSHRTMGNRSRFQILETAEDSESDEEDYLPLITTKPAVEPTTGGGGDRC